MKLSIAISALILAAAAGLVWQIDGRLAAACNYERKLASEAAKLGISIRHDQTVRSTKRQRVNREAEARRLAVEFIKMAKQCEKGVEIDVAAQQRFQEIYQRTSLLDASQLKIRILELLTTKELSQKGRVNHLISALWTYAEKDPRDALALLTKHFAILKDHPHSQDVLSSSLGTWAKDDPAAAVEWMKKNAAEFPDAMKAQSQANVFRAAAEKDPRLAFTLIAVLGLNYSDSHSALHDIVTAAATDEQRNVTLAALREYRVANKNDGTLTRAVDENFGYLGSGFEKEGFAAATRWLASANLTPKELDNICGRLGLNYEGDEPAQWIEWYGHQVLLGKADDQIGNWISVWTRRNYEAAGRWLASTSEGPVRNAAICSYAETIFPQESEVAMQWIKTLPPGEQRQNTLQYIHENYLQNDPEAAAAFKAEHGLK